MRKSLTLLLICILAVSCLAQNPNQPQPQIATTLAFPLLNPPQAPVSLNIATSGAPGPSSSTVFYWLVAEFPIGNSTPAGPFQAFNVPATLSGGNFEILNWPAVAGATGYDVLKTTTNMAPTGACACAVVTNTANTTVNDQSNSTGAYTVNTFSANGVMVQLTNEPYSPGVSHLVLRQAGLQLGDLSTSTNRTFRNLSGNTATITTTTLYTVPQSGLYKVNFYMDSQAVCVTPGPASVQLTIGWADTLGSHTFNPSTPLALGTLGPFSAGQASINVYVTVGQNITYATALVACTSGTATYSLRMEVEQLF